MKATEFLKQDHDTVNGLFKEYRESEGQDISEKRQIFERIRQELEVHAQIEEKLFYPSVRECGEEVSSIIDEGIDEHKMMEDLLGELTEPQSDDEFINKMGELINCVEHHVGEEENELFPKVEQFMDEDRLEELCNQLEALKADLEIDAEAVDTSVSVMSGEEEDEDVEVLSMEAPSTEDETGTYSGSEMNTSPDEGVDRDL
jgi:hemerythrin superfamily protein